MDLYIFQLTHILIITINKWDHELVIVSPCFITTVSCAGNIKLKTISNTSHTDHAMEMFSFVVIIFRAYEIVLLFTYIVTNTSLSDIGIFRLRVIPNSHLTYGIHIFIKQIKLYSVYIARSLRFST